MTAEFRKTRIAVHWNSEFVRLVLVEPEYFGLIVRLFARNPPVLVGLAGLLARPGLLGFPAFPDRWGYSDFPAFLVLVDRRIDLFRRYCFGHFVVRSLNFRNPRRMIGFLLQNSRHFVQLPNWNHQCFQIVLSFQRSRLYQKPHPVGRYYAHLVHRLCRRSLSHFRMCCIHPDFGQTSC